MRPSTARARRHLWPLIVIASLGLLQGCSGNDDDGLNNPPADGSIIMPLAIGNTWTYESTYVGVDDPETYTMTSTGVETVADVSVTTVEYSGMIPISIYYVYYRNNAGNLYFYGDMFEEYDTPDLLCKSTCSVGDSWYRSGVTWEVIATSESVTVPEGTYDCIHMRDTVDEGGGRVTDIWYAIGVGMIKSVGDTQTDVLISKSID